MSPKYEFVKYILITFVAIFTLVDTLVLRNSGEFVIFILFLLWLVIMTLLKPNKDIFNKIGMGLFALIPILVIVRLFEVAERVAIWLFLYLVVKCVIEFKDYIKNER
ncbi:hypothetical protein A3F07_00915 [candidate division WWE3 bacterium RIFCSPHIGHO2_12_FULL_38_15]|uniref:Uncharacterized protein n=1 Tax=candidate division WWE3 bacterium RIFCSPHIGHO2_02_FULL_38_14 TaxID=1802620 RepID=A0A1F4VAZ9_UNCKA|nr:MAG: hypothetical protein A2793_03885 [candidate division WWE3 bacterium RIFCSPHIGHO2_01_FULL_38_45]OGC49135.1 MAG: hypothetical protein A3F07_00915 [candidate division WWE3 bacterium RIFCSPHIGHO2_12_FULL_38_15]OGC52599.1 MAG: hypothetical protein A3B64_03490 [candidate division WWE3 bacterium RIFCSPLOWO2_01_FULL_37_24]OGC54090.1 MAG: hypothetical protein A3D91_05015 [candidate division WWE3 bacterium RIFCSPHIGHO2_02_FULL_38_14]HLB51738.1 hypothetical protein [Patescibacteria group bacterium